jgi:queuosine precursor transporter
MVIDPCDKRIRLYTVLSAVFLSALLLAEVTGGKLIALPSFGGMPFSMTMGVLPFPMTFVITDLINEFYGRAGIRYITFVGMGAVLLVLLLLRLDMLVPASAISPIDDRSFNVVFGFSSRIIIGSLIAFLAGQLIDIAVFHLFRSRTGLRMFWLRATGSTLVSQLIDSALVLYIAFIGTMSPVDIGAVVAANYVYKAIIAIAATPLLYLIRAAIRWYLGDDLAIRMLREVDESEQRTAARHGVVSS